MEKDKKNYLQLKPEDAAKLERFRGKQDAAIKVDDTLLLEAEFGMLFGYRGIEAIENDEIPLQRVLELVVAARKIDTRHQYNAAAATFTAVASANSKYPSNAFQANTRHYEREMRADA